MTKPQGATKSKKLTNNKTWEVQVGFGRGAYKLKYNCTSSAKAIFWFNGLNTHSGYKKRLVDANGRVIARVIT